MYALREIPNGSEGVDLDKEFFYPLLEAFGDDEQAIKDYIIKMSVDDRQIISGISEDIYGKFMNEEMWDFLDIFEN